MILALLAAVFAAQAVTVDRAAHAVTFAPSETRLESFYRLRPTLPKTIRNWYLYADGP